jgi:hypothetical protein
MLGAYRITWGSDSKIRRAQPQAISRTRLIALDVRARSYSPRIPRMALGVGTPPLVPVEWGAIGLAIRD